MASGGETWMAREPAGTSAGVGSYKEQNRKEISNLRSLSGEEITIVVDRERRE